MNTQTGAYQNFSFGGGGNSEVPPKFNCPHGINYDPRKDLIIVSDRANHRLMYINFDGTFNSSKAMPALTLPCNADFGFDDTHVLIPNLGDGNHNGTFLQHLSD